MALNKFGMGFVVSAVDQASQVFNKVGGGFSHMTDRIERDARRQAAAMQNIAIGGAMALFSRQAFAGFGSAIDLSKQLSVALSEVTTLTDEASFSMAKMSEITAAAASKYGEDQVSQTKALYQIISAGFGDVQQATELLDAANKMAVAGVSDVATSVDGLTNVLNNFRDKSAGAISDEMFVAVKAGKTTIDELASSVGKIAPLMDSVGESSQSMFAQIATVTTKGIVTAEAVSGLKAALSNVMKPTKDAQDEAKRLGVQFNIAALRSKGFVGILNEVSSSSKFNNETMSKLFGSVEGLNAALAISANNGEKYNEIMKQMENSQGATNVAFQKMSETLSFQEKRFGAISDNIKRTFGASLERLLLPFAKVMVRLADGFERWIKSLPPEVLDTITSVVAAMAGFIGLVGGLLVLRGTLGLLGVSFTGLLHTFAAITIAAPAVILLLGGLGVAAYAAYRAFEKNVGGISTTWDGFVSKAKLAWEGLVAIIRGQSFSDELSNELGKAENKGLAKFLNSAETTYVRLKSFWEGLRAGFEEGVNRLAESPVFQKVKEQLNGLFSLFTGTEMGNSQAQLDMWADKGVNAGLKIAKLGEYIFEAMTKVIEFGKKFASSMQNVTADDIVEGINTLIESFRTMIEVIKFTGTVLSYIVPIVKIVVNAIQILGALISESIANWLVNLGYLGDAIGKLLKKDFEGAAQAASKFEAKKMIPGVGLAFSAADVITDKESATFKEAGDMIRIFDPENTAGLEGEIEKRRVTELKVRQQDTIQMIRQYGTESKEGEAQLELLRQINVSLEALTHQVQPPVRVLLEGSRVNSILDDFRRGEAERDVESNFIPVDSTYF